MWREWTEKCWPLFGCAKGPNLIISWNQSWTGTDQKRVAHFEGNRVYLSTPPSVDPITGTMSVRTMTWEKLG